MCPELTRRAALHYAIPHASAAFMAKQVLLPMTSVPVVTTLHGTDITLVVGRQPEPVVTFSINQATVNRPFPPVAPKEILVAIEG
jgi:hypothetical protein